MIRNLRDLSIIAREAGVPLREGCLIRSGSLHQATPEDLIGIDSVIDLRTQTELEKKPDRIADWISYYHIPIFDEAAAGITREKSLTDVPDMRHLYRAMIEVERFRVQLEHALQVISAHDYTKGAILWHCTVGKDRSGIVSAMVLRSLGVSRKYILQDYLLSNEDCIGEAEAAFQLMLHSGRSAETALAMREVYLAMPEYLQAAFDAQDRNPLVFPEVQRFRDAVLLPSDL